MKWELTWAFCYVDALPQGYICTLIIILDETNLKVKHSIKSGRSGSGMLQKEKYAVALVIWHSLCQWISHSFVANTVSVQPLILYIVLDFVPNIAYFSLLSTENRIVSKVFCLIFIAQVPKMHDLVEHKCNFLHRNKYE